ncbi:MAG TPA: hypothetical protein VN693_03765 [Rhodanobacteraceae bacterium]|nr:hypothetical protein [Rhodanobacteraceae bacterium]
MRTLRLLFWILPALLLAGCGDPRDKTLPLDIATSPDVRETLAKLTPSEQQAIAEYEIRRAARLAQGDKSASKSVTYREAITDQLVYDTAEAQRVEAINVRAQAEQEEAEAKKVQAAKIAADNAKLMHESIQCRLENKQFDSIPKPDATDMPFPQVTYDFTCRNASSFVVNGFKGLLFLNGPYGESVASIRIRHDSPLAPGSSFELNTKSEFVDLDPGLTARTFYDLPVGKISTDVELDSLVKSNGELIHSDNWNPLSL